MWALETVPESTEVEIGRGGTCLKSQHSWEVGAVIFGSMMNSTSRGFMRPQYPPNKLINRWRIAEILSSESPQLPDCSRCLCLVYFLLL